MTEEATPDRWDAEDVADGTPLSGADSLVDRIEVALYDAYDSGAEQGAGEGYDEALDDIETTLDLDTDRPSGGADTEGYRVAVIAWLKDAFATQLEDARREGFNEGVEALADELGTKRADKLAGDLLKIDV